MAVQVVGTDCWSPCDDEALLWTLDHEPLLLVKLLVISQGVAADDPDVATADIGEEASFVVRGPFAPFTTYSMDSSSKCATMLSQCHGTGGPFSSK